MGRLAALCGVFVVFAGACGGGDGWTGGDTTAPSADAGDGPPHQCPGTEPWAGCVLAPDGELDDPWGDPGIRLAIMGVVVEAGSGAPPEEGCYIAGSSFRIGAGDPGDPEARWFRLEDVAGDPWTVAWRVGNDTPHLAVGEAAIVHYAHHREPFASSSGEVAVFRPGGVLVGWWGTAGLVEDLTPPGDLRLARGPIAAEESDDCGSWARYDLVAVVGEEVGVVPEACEAEIGGHLVRHGGLRLQTSTDVQCMDWFVADAAAAILALPEEPVVYAERPAPLWPGPCVERYAPDNLAVRYTYDDADRVVREERDYGDDGSVETALSRTYDTAGNLTSLAVEGHGSEERVASSDRHVYVYDEAGRLVREEHENAAGEVDTRKSYTYDARGFLVAEDWDMDADGDVDRSCRFAVDDAGHVTEEAWDDGADGSVDSRIERDYDAEGRIIEERNDLDADGIPEGRNRHTWFAVGHRIVSEDDGGDPHCCVDDGPCYHPCPADGQVHSRVVSILDSEERRTLRLFDGGGSAPDLPDGVADRTDGVRYDPAGRPLRRETRDAAGELTDYVLYDYDAHGDLVGRQTFGPRGESTTSVTYARDEVGNVLEERRSVGDGGGTIVTSYEYDCWRERSAR